MVFAGKEIEEIRVSRLRRATPFRSSIFCPFPDWSDSHFGICDIIVYFDSRSVDDEKEEDVGLLGCPSYPCS